MSLVSLTNEREHVIEVLEEVANADYNSIFVFGYKDGRISHHFSSIQDITKLIGALEMAKHEIMMIDVKEQL